MKDLAGKVAFVTGGASGIGLAMARSFAGAGMKVVLADVEDDALEEAVKSFEGTNADVHGIVVDVTDRHAMASAADEAEAHFGKVHVVCNNAGVGGGGPIGTATYNDWDWVLGVNIDGVVNGIQTFVDRIKAHGEGGHFVNTASVAGLIGIGGMGVYNASKFAVVGISEAMRQDLADDDIGVSVLCPGFVRTNIWQSGRNRPEEFQNEDAPPPPEPADDDAPIENRVLSGIDPAIVGEKVLKAVENNELYILTHPELKGAYAMRAAHILEAFGDEAEGDETQAEAARTIEAAVAANLAARE